ncbi:TetR/AcrR family transcriptional regulator [Patulibacter sp. SYSU D01012]|uniref:TetR/AcrR family transcriptional regulator n=1 Tax=Patulibacter sp. SYSU D01012 TaxID=2817381 RepID=UPI001B312DFD|nr:TetR/AcrR family transcriptional regulator [Patulibacter sp. SYSU D01012]
MPAADRPAPAADAAAVAGFPHGRVPRAVREEQVLAIAQGLFAERGYQGASMDEVALRAGVSKPVVYDLVGNKEALYLRCVERAGRALADVVATAALAEQDAAGRMRAGAIAFLRFVAEERGGWDLLLTAGPEPGAEPILAVRAQQSALLTSLVRETIDAQGLDLEPWRTESVAHALNGAFEGLAYWWRAHREIDAEELVDWITRLFLPGIEALAGPTGGDGG